MTFSGGVITTSSGLLDDIGVQRTHSFGAVDCSASNTGTRERGLLSRLTAATALMVLALSVGAGMVRAHGRNEKSEQTVIKSREFTIQKGRCSQLPGDLEVKGLGLERTTTVVESADDRGQPAGDDDDGRITYSLLSTITGTATDNLGGAYTFRYQLRFRAPSLLPGSAIRRSSSTPRSSPP